MNVLFTAGTQFPFPRLARVAESVSAARPDWQLVYQAGPGAADEAWPKGEGLKVQPLFGACEFDSLFSEADLVVTHAGMGNIVTCLERGKPFLMMPRLVRLSEHRNDHQIDTAKAISQRYDVPIYLDVTGLVDAVLSFRAGTEPSARRQARIQRERHAYGERLNALIRHL